MKSSDLRVIPFYFMGQGALIEPHPVCKKEFELATKYIHEELAGQIYLSDFEKSFAVIEYDGENPVACHGVSVGGWKWDIPVFRVSGEKAKRATKLLFDRWQSALSDSGLRGKSVSIYIKTDDSPLAMCPNWEQSIRELDCRPSHRFDVKVL
jgi:hypothetical protein